MPTPPTTAEDLATLVTYAARLVRQIRRAQGEDFPVALLRLTSLLDELGPSTVTDLARADAISQPSMTSLVKSLIERGWGRRAAHPSDARASLIELTAAGHERLIQARRENADLLASRLTPSHADDVAAAVALLKQLLDAE